VRRPLIRLSVVLGIIVGSLVVNPAAASASNWAETLQSGSTAESQSQTKPATPTGVGATCTSLFLTTVQVTWTAVPRATAYTVYESTTSSSTGFSAVATGVAGTSWTSGSLTLGSYWFEVAAYIGTNWASSNSAATAPRTITLGLLCT